MTFPFISTICRHAQTAASASGCLPRIDRLSKVSYYIVASKISRNSLVQFSGIATVYKEIYTDILRCLGDAVSRKRPEKWRTNNWSLPQDNAPAHRSVLVRLLSEERCDNPGAPSDLAPADVYLFRRLNSALKGWRFGDATAILKTATEELKRLSQNGMLPTPLPSLA
jgi:hypothetical protein